MSHTLDHIREELLSFMTQEHRSQAYIAEKIRDIGQLDTFTSAAISNFLRGKAKPQDRNLRAIILYLQSQGRLLDEQEETKVPA